MAAAEHERAGERRCGRRGPRAAGPVPAAIGRTSSADRQVDASARSARPAGRRPASSATTMTAPRIGSSRQRAATRSKSCPLRARPRARPLAAIGDQVRQPPEHEGRQRRSSTPSVSAAVTGRPTMPARRKMAMKASSAATIQTTVCSRLTGTPSRPPGRRCRRWPGSRRRRRCARRKTRERDDASGRRRSRSTSLAVEDRCRRSRRCASNGWSSRGASRGGVARTACGRRMRAGGEQLGEAERGDREEEAGRLEEATDDRELDDRAEDERADEAGRQRRGGTASPTRSISMSIRTTGAVPRSAWAKLTMRLAR